MTAAEQLSPEYRELVTTANLDWQVQEYVRATEKVVEHSSHEVRAAAIREIAVAQHGDAFNRAVARY
jgi:hypothetical protein